MKSRIKHDIDEECKSLRMKIYRKWIHDIRNETMTSRILSLRMNPWHREWDVPIKIENKSERRDSWYSESEFQSTNKEYTRSVFATHEGENSLMDESSQLPDDEEILIKILRRQTFLSMSSILFSLDKHWFEIAFVFISIRRNDSNQSWTWEWIHVIENERHRECINDIENESMIPTMNACHQDRQGNGIVIWHITCMKNTHTRRIHVQIA